MSSLPLILSLADELDGLNELGDLLYRNVGQRFYQPQRHYHHHQHPSLRLVIPAFNAVKKTKEAEGVASPVGKEGFQVCMDVQQFKPSELTVKTVENSIVVEGKHEERSDEHGFISRHFVRRYVLPENYDPKQVVSTLSSDGVLTVKVPAPQKAEGANERIVQIQHTGPAHLSVKENANAEKEEKKTEEKK